MFSRRNFIHLASSLGAGVNLAPISDAVKTAIVEGISSIAQANQALSIDSIFALGVNLGTVASGLEDSKFSIYVGSALKSAAIALKETPCLSIPLVDLYTFPHSDSVLGGLCNRAPDWPKERVAEISRPPQFMLDYEIPGHKSYASKVLNENGVLSNPQTIKRFIELNNQYRSSLEQALQTPQVANWLSRCQHSDVLSELHRMLGAHKKISSMVKDISALLSNSRGEPFLKNFTNALVKGQYKNIIDHPVISACERLADLSLHEMSKMFDSSCIPDDRTGLLQKDPKAWMQKNSDQVRKLEGAEQDLKILEQHGIKLPNDDGIRSQLDECNSRILEISESIRVQESQRYTPCGSAAIIKNAIVVSELNARPLGRKFNKTKNGYWIDRNGVYLILPRIDRKREQGFQLENGI